MNGIERAQNGPHFHNAGAENNGRHLLRTFRRARLPIFHVRHLSRDADTSFDCGPPISPEASYRAAPAHPSREFTTVETTDTICTPIGGQRLSGPRGNQGPVPAGAASACPSAGKT